MGGASTVGVLSEQTTGTCRFQISRLVLESCIREIKKKLEEIN